MKNKVRVSAIVSTYNSEKYIRGCLDDLINQTLYKKGELEIVVVVSGSKENEAEIVQEYQSKFANIILITTEERETIYKAWNRGIKASIGKYVTNANTDDRHKYDALEILSEELIKNNDIALAYADSKVTQTENQTFDKLPLSGYLLWPEFNRKRLFEICYVGPQPMWRRSLHEHYGYFDEDFKSAGDYEFWLRISAKEKFKHVNQLLGLYYLSMNSVENSDRSTSFNESETARARHWKENKSRPAVEGAYLILYKESKLQVKKPRFSIVLPTFNRPQELHNALVSLEKQSFNNFEVIVVNDGKDDLSGLVDEFEGKIYIRYLHHIINRERSASRNDAIKVANGNYVTFLDDDDIYYPDHLQLLADNINENEKVLYTDAVRALYEKNDTGYKLVEKFVPYSIDYDRNKLLIGNIAPINCFAVEHSLAIQSGLFDENLNVLEDWEFLLRLSSLSEFKHIKQSTVEVTWKNDGSTTTSSKKNEFSLVREKIYKKYENEIALIPNRDEIIKEFNAIWHNDFKKKKSDVSIIIVTYNQVEYTKLIVNSIIENTSRNYELVFIDNASTDLTLEYLEKLKEGNGSVTIIRNTKNEGFPKAVNQGLLISKGDYVVLLNNDVVVTDGWMDRLITVAESDNKIGIVGPISNSVSGVQIDKEAKYKSIPEMHTYAQKIRKKNRSKIMDFPRVAFLCTLIKRDVIDSIGGLDERFSPGNYEDDDFCLRAQLAGYKTVIAKDVFIHHFGSKSFTEEGNDKYLELLEINKTKFIDKWGADPNDIWLKGVKPKSGDIVYPLNENTFIKSFRRATKNISEKDFKSASNNLKVAIEKYEINDGSSIIDYDTLLNLAGNVSLINGDYPLAREYFEEELNLKADSSIACSGLAEVLFVEENYEESKTMYEWAVKNDMQNEAALKGLRKVNTILQLPEDENSLYGKSENSPLDNADAIIKNAHNQFESKNFNGALTLVKQAEELMQDDSLKEQKEALFVSLNNFKGYCYIGLNKLDEAKSLFKSALQIEPNSSDSCAGLGEVIYLSGNDEEAKTMFEWAVKNDPENIFALEGLKKVNNNLGFEETHNSLLIIN
ncbi:MAG: glycosyltransferase [Bacteroidetes bacterium]|nr:glycosyltransferase [Bacteroidota bacterium]